MTFLALPCGFPNRLYLVGLSWWAAERYAGGLPRRFYTP